MAQRSMIVAVFAAGCSHGTAVSDGPNIAVAHRHAASRGPHAAKPLAVLDDMKPFRRYVALASVRDNPDHTRTLELVSFTATDYAPGTQRVGWLGHTAITLDTRRMWEVDSEANREETWSAFGNIELPADGQWIGVDASLELSPAVRAALARHDAHEPSLPLASFVPRDAPMVPVGYIPRVTVRAGLIGGGDVRVPLELHDAVFGTAARGMADLPRRDGHPWLRATLAPNEPRMPTPGHTSAQYAGTLTIHIEDDLGRTATRSYPVSGSIELDGDSVIAPVGLRIADLSHLGRLQLGEDGGQLPLALMIEGVWPFDARRDNAGREMPSVRRE